jgi:hypothetical protein
MGDRRATIGRRFAGRELPLPVKVVYTLFVGVLVPVYWRHYGPANFLWFSDVALLLTVPALWLESRWLASTQAVSVGLLELVWIADFLVRLVTGVQLTGIAGYMFEADKPLYLRGLSLFHLVLPFLLLWMTYRLGYDRRAWLAQTVLAWAILLVCFFFTDRAENINWVFGPGREPQDWVAPGLYLALLMVAFPVGVYLPTHLTLRALMPRSAGSSPRRGEDITRGA